MSDAWRSLKIKQFEWVAAGPSLALLRVTGKGARRHTATPQERPTLLADNGREVARFAALPSPPDDRGVLRAAYSVPEGTITPDTVFSLELKDGHVIALPAPASRSGSGPAAQATDPVRSGPTAPPGPAPAAPAPLVTPEPGLAAPAAAAPAAAAPPSAAPAAAAPPTAEPQEVTALRHQLADANRRAEDALLEAAAVRDQREALERRTAELEHTLRERQASLEELEVWRGELERRLASMSTELGDTTGRLRTAEQELQGLREPLPETEAGAGHDTGPPATPEAADLEELRRRAAADAAEVAARELAEAAADTPEPEL